MTLPPRWWVILWSVWGLLVAGLVLLLDPQPWLAVPWAVGGVIVGLFGLPALRPFAGPFLDWYSRRNPNDGVYLERFWLFRKDESDPQEFHRWMASEEFRRYMAEEDFWHCLPVAPLFGLFHGVLAGAVVGALCGSGAAGALVGVLVGPMFVACVVALTVASSVDVGRHLSFPVRCTRRILLVVSPLLFIPAAWHSLWTVFRRTTGRTPMHP